ncbi:MAG: aldo/keto reductase, partial [Planctomycetes bacterium]|nr:aldo/keto reductase [Planctomycetota bacterium]
MKYRVLGNTEKRVSVLGFGAMRLPTSGKAAEVDESAAVELLRFALDQGVNYIDTAYVYHDGVSERVVGQALQDGYRAKALVATKAPVWSINEVGDFDRILDEQLARLQADHVDFYLLHCLEKRTWPKIRDLGVFRWAERARADGRIGEFGFSFHDRFEVFREIVDAYDWTFCQIQYNLISEDVQAGTQGLRYAAAKGLGVIIMEPLFGGSLANPPPSVREIWRDGGCTPADIALRWLWDKPEVSLVLSGMNSLTQVRENVASANAAEIGALSSTEHALVRRAQEEFRRLAPISCTKCGYCLPCPHGVDIPRNFGLFNDVTIFSGNNMVLCRNLYWLMPES